MLLPWLESVYADAVFGWRQLLKRKVTSAAAILSLALAIGACVSAFRLMDAMLWRPLPVAAPERLYALAHEYTGPDGKDSVGDAFAYPLFRQMRAVVKDQAELIAISIANRMDLTYGSDQESEKAYGQYVSGWMFQSFGIHPALGRVFTENDDLTPGAHPYAVLSYDYWRRRFGKDPKVIGRTFRTGNELYQIVGVAEGPFVGTEPGTITDIFVPTMMMTNRAIVRLDYQWFRTFVHLKPEVSPSLVQEKLRPSFQGFLETRAGSMGGIPARQRESFLHQRLLLRSASAGVSGTQRYYATALSVLGVLVTLVLLISCANVANLMTAQATARQREMALRISIGAARWRLVQLVVIECAWLTFLAAAMGVAFAGWAAPAVVQMIGTPDSPVRLVLHTDWKVLAFAIAVALTCTILFGLMPAFRASGVKPVHALRGGQPHARTRVMQLLIAVQVAFSVLVLFVAGLFMSSSGRLTHQSTGFSAERLLTVETVTPQPQPAFLWRQVADRLRSQPGVEAVALCEWPLLTGGSWNGFISVNGGAPGPTASYFLNVSPEFRGLMQIPLLQGADLRTVEGSSDDVLVNQAFVHEFFRGESAVGRWFDVVSNEGKRAPHRIAGVVGDARYRDMREDIQPTVFFPFQVQFSRATFMVRSASQDPMTLAAALRRDIPQARPGFRVSNILTQTALIEQHTVRERLLAMLALFFGVVALALAGVGLYGVLDYSVLQRRREIGIRIAIGAQAGHIARSVIAGILAVVLAGALIGIALGMASVRWIEALLYGVKATGLAALAAPTVIIFAVALLAALPAVIRAVRIDPATMLRSE